MSAGHKGAKVAGTCRGQRVSGKAAGDGCAVPPTESRDERNDMIVNTDIAREIKATFNTARELMRWGENNLGTNDPDGTDLLGKARVGLTILADAYRCKIRRAAEAGKPDDVEYYEHLARQYETMLACMDHALDEGGSAALAVGRAMDSLNTLEARMLEAAMAWCGTGRCPGRTSSGANRESP